MENVVRKQDVVRKWDASRQWGPIGVISVLTFQEALRRKILWAALGLGAAFLILYGIGLYYINREVRADMGTNTAVIREMLNFMMMAGLYVVNFLVVMMTVLTSVDTLSGEITSGTIQTVVSKPLSRYQVVVGKWLGFAVMLTLYVLLMAGGVIGITYALSGILPPRVAPGLALMVLEALVMLSVSLMGGTWLSTLANGVLAFGLYSLAFIGGWIEQIGSYLRNETAVNIGIVSSLLLPSEALWRRAAYEMQSPLSRDFGITPFASASVPSTAMIVYAVLYSLAMLSVAVLVFGRRDL
ncbi:MAG: ABC transporter permease [Thermoflexales bacterium]|nr:ABC transporter permease [Thermoflexales bacterium]